MSTDAGDRIRPISLPRPKDHQPSFSRREGPLLLTTRLLAGTIARFPGHPPLDRRTVGGATPTLLSGVPSGGVCGSAHLLTSDRVLNGDRVESETGRVRRPLLADWLRRDAMPTLDSAHAHACWRAREECRERHGVRMEVKMALLSLVLLSLVLLSLVLLNKKKPDD